MSIAAARALGELERETLLRLIDLVARKRAADQTLDRIDGVLRIEEPALLGGSAYEHVTAGVKRDHGRDQRALTVREDANAWLIGNGHDRVGRT